MKVTVFGIGYVGLVQGAVLTIAKTIAQHMEGHRIVIDKLTVPAGTADKVSVTMVEVLAERGLSDLALFGTKEAALKNADALAIGTEWQGFKSPGFDTVKELLIESTIFDDRNLYEPQRMSKRGFNYNSVARKIRA